MPVPIALDAAPAWALRDFITASVAASALGLSLWNTWRARIDRQQDQLRLVRSQLTDTLLAISETRIARREATPMGTDPIESRVSKRATRGALSDRLRFLCHQAAYLVDQIPGRVAPIEHGLMGMAYEDFGEHANAEVAHRRSLLTSATPKEKAHALRALGRVLFELHRHEEGRAEFRSAEHVQTAIATNDAKQDAVDTLLRWAEAEDANGDRSRVAALLDRAEHVASQITNDSRRSDARFNIESRATQLRSRLTPAVSPAIASSTSSAPAA